MQARFTHREATRLLAAVVACASALAGCAGPAGVPPAGVAAPAPASYGDSTLTISTAYGAVPGTIVVALASSVEGAAIRYYAGGAAIDTENPPGTVPYQGPFVLWPQALYDDSTAVVFAVASVGGEDRPATWQYFRMGPPPDPRPVFSPPPGTYGAPQEVTIRTSVPEATIIYTLDGTEPRWDGTRYTGPIRVDATTTIRAMVELNYDSTPITEGRYSF